MFETDLRRIHYMQCFMGGFAWTGIGAVALIALGLLFGIDSGLLVSWSLIGAVAGSVFGWHRHRDAIAHMVSGKVSS